MTGATSPRYSSGDVFVIGGMINPTLVIPQGANVRMIFVNLDDDMCHNIVVTSVSPPYTNMPMQVMMNGGGMMENGGNYNGDYYYFNMPFVSPANYDQGTASAYSYSFTISGQSNMWYACTYPGHAESWMYGRILVSP